MFTAYRNGAAICSGTDFESTKAGTMEYLYRVYSNIGYVSWEYNENNKHFELRKPNCDTIYAYIPGLGAKNV